MSGAVNYLDQLKTYIFSKWDCVSYAQHIGHPIYPKSRGEFRGPSLEHGHKSKTALTIYNNGESFFDWTLNQGGNVIAMCAFAEFSGDFSAACKYLGQGFSPLDENGREYDWHSDNRKWNEQQADFEDKINAWHEALRPQDIEYLHSRRIKDSTISKLKIGFDEDRYRLVIPFWKNGKPVYYITRGLREPFTDRYPKYQKMKQSGKFVNTAWGWDSINWRMSDQEALVEIGGQTFDKRKILVITEGMMDAMSYWQEGWQVLSPGGGNFGAQSLKEVLATAKRIGSVFLCFDSDGAGKGFQDKLSKILFKEQIPFICGSIPDGFKDVNEAYAAGVDINYFIAKAQKGLNFMAASFTSRDEFRTFLDDASRSADKCDLLELCEHVSQFPKRWVQTALATALKCPPEIKIASEIVDNNFFVYKEGEGFYVYEDDIWTLRPDLFIKNLIIKRLGNFATNSKANSICEMIKSMVLVDYEFNKKPVMAMDNGTVHLDKIDDRIRTAQKIEDVKLPDIPEEPSPDDMTTIKLPYSYEPHTECYAWQKFINDVTEGNKHRAKLLQEIAAYPLFPDNPMQKFFVLMGDGNNGKSVFIDVLREVYGQKNCTSVELSRLNEPFDVIRLQHSLVNFCTEPKVQLRDSEAMIKAIVAGDVISGAKKFCDAVDFKPRVKLICSTNNFLTANDITFGFMRRLLFVPFNRTFLEGVDMDKQLTPRLLLERPAIFNWVLEGYIRLKKNMAFTKIPEDAELREKYMSLINPVYTYIYKAMKPASADDVLPKYYTLEEIFNDYLDFCKAMNCKPLNFMQFERNLEVTLNQNYPNATEIQPTIFGSDKVLMLKGYIWEKRPTVTLYN